MPFLPGTSHFWSLCIEVQFYLMVAAGFFFYRERGLLFFMIAGLGVTAFRIYDGVLVNITTYYRIDEILAGLTLALVFNNRLGTLLPRLLAWVNPYLILILFLTSCHPETGAMNYFRPYFAATLVGSTLYNSTTCLTHFLNIKILVYLAAVSYALYVIHPLLAHSWLGSGETLEKYAKRPILFILLFGLAHVSTFYSEKYWVSLSKKLTSKQKTTVN
jgi:peptidoglycan/LPS O-acetylase OafA/YrhL